MIIDAKAIMVDGVPFTVKVYKDDISRIDEYDCYNEIMRRSYKRDEWEFVGVVIVRADTGPSEPEVWDSVWGVEYGTLYPGCSVSVADIVSREDIIDMARDLL